MRPLALAGFALLAGGAAAAQSVPSAIYTDPPADVAHPAHMTVLAIPTHGLRINGIIYQPSGAGPHPTLILLHGLPGNEKNLDLAQAVRRAGWNAVTFNYRGSWGSPGSFQFAQTLEDADAVLAWLRDPAIADSLGVDTSRLVLAGHSMGGWVAASTASHDHRLAGVILISAADVARQGEWPRDRLVAFMADCVPPLAGVTAASMADDARALGSELRLGRDAAGLSRLPLLALTADDGLASDTDSLVSAIEAAGGHQVTSRHFATDHNWSGRRIALESVILGWLAARVGR